MATWNQPQQQTAPETARLACSHAALDSAESSEVECADLKGNINVRDRVKMNEVHVLL